MKSEMTAGGTPLAGANANRPVDYLDLKKYAGEWHEIARLPNAFQRQCADSVSATYTLLGDGTVDIRNACRTQRGQFDARVGVGRPTAIPGALKVCFAPGWLFWLPFVWADYWVVGLDLSYQWALVGGPSRRRLWILCRTPKMKRALFEKLQEAASVMGYETSQLVLTSTLA